MSQVHIFGQQANPGTAADGTSVGARGDRTGVAYTATWKESLVHEGRVFSAAFGAMGATDITELTAGSNLDQPDFGISVPNNTALIPLEIVIAAKVPLDADDADAYFLVIADPDAAYAGDGTVVSVSPTNNLTGGGQSTVATVFEDASADITDPTGTSFIIVAKQLQVGMTTSGVAQSDLNIHWVADVPVILNGPAAIYGYGGGSDSVTWAGRVTWAEVPESRFS